MNRIEINTKKTFELEEFYFHYINEDGLTVLCMTDKIGNKKVPFAFMQELKKNLLITYNPREIENAKAYQLSTFTDKIRETIVSLASFFEEIFLTLFCRASTIATPI